MHIKHKIEERSLIQNTNQHVFYSTSFRYKARNEILNYKNETLIENASSQDV